jgi:hypothetical protein
MGRIRWLVSGRTGEMMTIALRGGPHGGERYRDDKHVRPFTVNNKWVYLPTGETDNEGRKIFAYDESASTKKQSRPQV